MERNRFLGGVPSCSVSLEWGYLPGDVEYLVEGIVEDNGAIRSMKHLLCTFAMNSGQA